MSKFKVGDVVFSVYNDGSPCSRFWGVGNKTRVVSFVGEERVKWISCSPGQKDEIITTRGAFAEGHIFLSEDTTFLEYRDALNEAIRRNEALQSELSLEIGRLKEM